MAARIQDESRVNEILDIIEGLNRFEIQIGIFGQDDSKILMIARVNEFGVDIDVTDKMRKYLHAMGLHLKSDTDKITIPERSFIRGSYDSNKTRLMRVVERNLEKLFNFELNLDQFQNQLGQYCVGFIQEYLTNLRNPSNHPYTLEQKAPKTNPLINTGELREKITYKVVRK